MVAVERVPIVPRYPLAPADFRMLAYADRPHTLRTLSPAAETALYAPEAFGARVSTYRPGNGTPPGGRGSGVVWTVQGTRTFREPNPAAAALADASTRDELVSVGTGPLQAAGLFSDAAPTVRRSDGFLFRARFSARTANVAAQRAGVGLLRAIATTLNPSDATDSVMMSFDPADAVGSGWYLHTRTGDLAAATGTRVRIEDIGGIAAPRTGIQVFELALYAAPGAPEIGALVLDLTADPVTPVVLADLALTATLPTASAALGFEINANPGTSGALAQQDVHFVRVRQP